MARSKISPIAVFEFQRRFNSSPNLCYSSSEARRVLMVTIMDMVVISVAGHGVKGSEEHNARHLEHLVDLTYA